MGGERCDPVTRSISEEKEKKKENVSSVLESCSNSFLIKPPDLSNVYS